MHDQEYRQNSYRQGNGKNPEPGIVISDPTAQCRSDGGRHDRCDSVERKREAPLLRRERIGEDRLGHGLESAATGTLNNAEEEQHAQAAGAAAENRSHCKYANADDEETFSAEQAGQPTAYREDYSIRHQIRSEHPAALIVTRTVAPRHVWQTDIGD